jgi:hypothetical protein
MGYEVSDSETFVRSVVNVEESDTWSRYEIAPAAAPQARVVDTGTAAIPVDGA